jgi:predicted nucleotidyltransferase
MTKQNALKLLSNNFDYLRKNFAVSGLSIFGSVARDQAGSKSDIDILVDFAGKATFDNYMDLKFYLQELLNMNVDLVTQKALRPQIREEIEKELINVPQ